MESSSASSHARDLLNVASPDTAALDILNSLLRTATHDRATGRALLAVERWTVDQLELLEVKPEDALSDDKVLDLLAAVRVVTTHLPAPIRRQTSARLGRLMAAALDELEPDFVPELLKETRQRMADDPGIRRRDVRFANRHLGVARED
jgi:hypothetical protein